MDSRSINVNNNIVIANNNNYNIILSFPISFDLTLGK